MKTAAFIATIVLALLAVPATASASVGVATTVNLTRVPGFVAMSSYQLPEGDAATLTYKVYQHRVNGAGFKLVRRVQHVVAAADGFDSAKLRAELRQVGYRVRVRMVDVSTAETAVTTVKIRL